MRMLTSARDRFGASVPVMKYNFQAGIRLGATVGASIASDPLPAGSYLVTASADVYISTAGPAGDAEGSSLLGAGIPFHILITEGQSITTRSVMMPCGVFIVPLE